MRLAILPLSVSFLAAQVLADGASILAAMSTISDATVALNETVNSFSTNPLQSLAEVGPLLVDSVTLLKDINDGAKVAQSSANLTLGETIQVAQATLSLRDVVTSTLSNIVAAKPKFDKLLIVSPTVLLNLKLEKDATDKFGVAVVSKVPAAFQGTANTLLAPIDTAFESAIAAYS